MQQVYPVKLNSIAPYAVKVPVDLGSYEARWRMTAVINSSTPSGIDGCIPGWFNRELDQNEAQRQADAGPTYLPAFDAGFEFLFSPYFQVWYDVPDDLRFVYLFAKVTTRAILIFETVEDPGACVVPVRVVNPRD